MKISSNCLPYTKVTLQSALVSLSFLLFFFSITTKMPQRLLKNVKYLASAKFIISASLYAGLFSGQASALIPAMMMINGVPSEKTKQTPLFISSVCFSIAACILFKRIQSISPHSLTQAYRAHFQKLMSYSSIGCLIQTFSYVAMCCLSKHSTSVNEVPNEEVHNKEVHNEKVPNKEISSKVISPETNVVEEKQTITMSKLPLLFSLDNQRGIPSLLKEINEVSPSSLCLRIDKSYNKNNPQQWKILEKKLRLKYIKVHLFISETRLDLQDPSSFLKFLHSPTVLSLNVNYDLLIILEIYLLNKSYWHHHASIKPFSLLEDLIRIGQNIENSSSYKKIKTNFLEKYSSLFFSFLTANQIASFKIKEKISEQSMQKLLEEIPKSSTLRKISLDFSDKNLSNSRLLGFPLFYKISLKAHHYPQDLFKNCIQNLHKNDPLCSLKIRIDTSLDPINLLFFNQYLSSSCSLKSLSLILDRRNNAYPPAFYKALSSNRSLYGLSIDISDNTICSQDLFQAISKQPFLVTLRLQSSFSFEELIAGCTLLFEAKKSLISLKLDIQSSISEEDFLSLCKFLSQQKSLQEIHISLTNPLHPLKDLPSCFTENPSLNVVIYSNHPDNEKRFFEQNSSSPFKEKHETFLKVIKKNDLSLVKNILDEGFNPHYFPNNSPYLSAIKQKRWKIVDIFFSKGFHSLPFLFNRPSPLKLSDFPHSLACLKSLQKQLRDTDSQNTVLAYLFPDLGSLSRFTHTCQRDPQEKKELFLP